MSHFRLSPSSLSLSLLSRFAYVRSVRVISLPACVLTENQNPLLSGFPVHPLLHAYLLFRLENPPAIFSASLFPIQIDPFIVAFLASSFLPVPVCTYRTNPAVYTRIVLSLTLFPRALPFPNDFLSWPHTHTH